MSTMVKPNQKKTKLPIQSMTGSSYVCFNLDGQLVSIYLKSLNHKSFKFILHLTESIPEYLLNFEKILKNPFKRGIFFCNINIEEQDQVETFFDEKLFNACCKKLAYLQKKYKLEDADEMDTVLEFYYKISKQENIRKYDKKFIKKLMEFFKIASEKLLECRVKEGEKMLVVLQTLLFKIKKSISLLEKLWNKMLGKKVKQLIKKTKRLLQSFNIKEISKEDVVKEVAFYIERNDINEEIKRFKGHTKELEKVIAQGGTIGRNSEFILQEMAREITTLSNKVQNYSISKIAVKIKLYVDQMKEIVQNVE